MSPDASEVARPSQESPGDGANSAETFEKDVSVVSLLEKDLSKLNKM